jgi:hypothetical protein
MGHDSTPMCKDRANNKLWACLDNLADPGPRDPGKWKQMKEPALEKVVRELILTQRFAEAEAMLLKDRAEAASTSDRPRSQLVLNLLVDLYSLQEPRDTARADAASLAREELAQTAYSKLQTAMVRYWAAHDYRGAIAKAHEAITQGREEQDDSTVYTALSLLGLGLIQVGDYSNAAGVIDQIERMVADERQIIIGDETSFLENARSHGLNLAAIARIASILAPLCRDPQFTRRLGALAKAE